jgi:hypothetical protein
MVTDLVEPPDRVVVVVGTVVVVVVVVLVDVADVVVVVDDEVDVEPSGGADVAVEEEVGAGDVVVTPVVVVTGPPTAVVLVGPGEGPVVVAVEVVDVFAVVAGEVSAFVESATVSSPFPSSDTPGPEHAAARTRNPTPILRRADRSLLPLARRNLTRALSWRSSSTTQRYRRIADLVHDCPTSDKEWLWRRRHRTSL